jgi:hypothetical protein
MNCPAIKCKNNKSGNCTVIDSELPAFNLDENGQCKYFIGPFVDPDQPPKIAYVCDRRVCKKCGHTECHYTLDVNHAVNFTKNLDGNFMEIEEEEDGN